MAGNASLFLSASAPGNAACTQQAPCSSFDTADASAVSGATVQVAPGEYSGEGDSYGGSPGVFHSTPVTFVCQPGAPSGSVSFTDPEFLLGPGGGNITFQGSCFHFHILVIGLRGYDSSTNPANRVSNVTVDGATMDSFDIAGAQNVTLENSQIGPIDDCFANAAQAAANGAPASAACDPNNPTEAYWASVGGTLGLQGEPFVHDNGDIDTNVTFDHDTFEGMQTKWPTVFHQGGLLVWSSSNLTIENSLFENNAIYNIEFNADSTETGDRIVNNTFGPATSTLAESDPGAPLPAGQCQEGLLDPAGESTFTDVVISGNTFAQCFNIGGPGKGDYTDVEFADNVIGSIANCPATPGITYSSDTAQGKPACG